MRPGGDERGADGRATRATRTPGATDDTGTSARDRRVAAVGTAGLVAMWLSLLVWDTAVTLVGVAAFGVAEEDAPLVRALLAVHPLAWVGVKTAAVVGVTALWWRLGVHRIAATAWLPWLVAAYGALAPLGWLELLLAG